MRARREPTADVDEALDAIYSDIGRLVFRLMNDNATSAKDGPPEPTESARPTFLPLTEEATQSTIPTEEDHGERLDWYTDEDEGDKDDGESAQPEPLFFSQDDRLDEMTDIPESDPISEEIEIDAVTDHEDYEVTGIAQMTRAQTEPNHPLHRLADSSSDPTWAYKLGELLHLLQLPTTQTADEMTVEASHIQWAASELPSRLDGLPQSVQVCIIGLLAARAQHLRSRLAVDVGPRLALDRLRRYRIDHELPTVVGLLATPAPECGSWSEDIKGWWTLLNPPKPDPEEDA